jgi:hypothetical protein
MEFLSNILREARQNGTSEILHKAIKEIDVEYAAAGKDIHNDPYQKLYINEIRKRYERMLAELKK